MVNYCCVPGIVRIELAYGCGYHHLESGIGGVSMHTHTLDENHPNIAVSETRFLSVLVQLFGTKQSTRRPPEVLIEKVYIWRQSHAHRMLLD